MPDQPSPEPRAPRDAWLHPTARTDPQDVDALLARGVEEGIITDRQRERLQALHGDERLPASRGHAAAHERESAGAANGEHPQGFNVVTVAYGVGAILVLFAAGWFLVDRWARLGAVGVLAIAIGYAVVLAAAARWLDQRHFRVAAGLCTVLAIAMTPLVAWSFLSMAGRWPDPASRDPLLYDAAWMAWQWLVLDLATLLVALLVFWRRPSDALAWPLAIALWGCWFHVGQLLRGPPDSALGFERWLMLANGLALLFVAERVERWQRRRWSVSGDAADGSAPARVASGDFANGFWIVGLIASAVAYLIIWGRAETAWRHLLPVLALALVVLSLYLRRRSLLLTGIVGVLGYLAYLAGEVFRDYVSFPILVAGFGVLLIFLTVWTQTRFPALVNRLEAGRASRTRTLPWSPVMAALPALVALVMALVALGDAEEERRASAFRERLTILRLHSGSIPSPRLRAPPEAKPLR